MQRCLACNITDDFGRWMRNFAKCTEYFNIQTEIQTLNYKRLNPKVKDLIMFWSFLKKKIIIIVLHMSTISDNYVSEPSCDPRVTEQESVETGLRQKCHAATTARAAAVALSSCSHTRIAAVTHTHTAYWGHCREKVEDDISHLYIHKQAGAQIHQLSMSQT